MRRNSSYGFAVAVVVAVVAALVVAHLTGRVGGTTATAVDNVSETLAAAGAAIACLLRARRAPQERRSWQLLAASSAAWCAGQLYWSCVEIGSDGEIPFPSWADVGYVAAIPLAVIGLSIMRREAGADMSWVRAGLDGVLVSASLLSLSWVAVLGPLYRADAETTMAKVLSLVYPAADVVIVTIVVVVLSRQHDQRRRVRAGLLAAGYVAIATADAGFAWMSQHEGVGGGHLINLDWVAGFALIGLAALLPGRATAIAAQPTRQSRVGMSISYVPVLVWGATVVTVELLGDGIDSFVFWCSFVVVATLMLRQGIALAENATLTNDLEARVMERTAAIESREARFAALVQHATDVIAVVPGLRLRTSYISPSAERLLGWSIEGGVDVLEQVHPDDVSRWDLALVALGIEPARAAESGSGARAAESGPGARAAESGSGARAAESGSGDLTTAFECRVRDGGDVGWRRAEVTLTDLRGDPDVAGIVINLRDITVRRALEDELRDQGLRDPLTNLANRALLRDRLLHALRRQRPDELGVIVVDLDDFTRVNEQIGDDGGDWVLRTIAERLRSTARRADTVARHGADEFVILADGDVDGAKLEALAASMARACREPIVIDETTIVVHASVGLSRGATGATADGLLGQASIALAAAKRGGKDEVRTYDPAMRRAQDDRLTLEAELRRAIDRDELVLHYQPLFATGTTRIVGAEALVRWQHPDRGLVPPGAFIPLAEQSGLIVPIGTWVLDTACRDAAAWPVPIGVSVNLSSVQLERDDLLPIVRSTLDRHGVVATRLTLEVTESLLLDDIERTVTTLDALRELGAHVAIDDFGTGFSSLSYLERLPADSLKIDRSFVVGLGAGTDRGVVTTIIDLAAKLGLRTVAEGVEEEEQHQILRYLGVDVIQGFLLGRPMPDAALVALLADSLQDDLLDQA